MTADKLLITTSVDILCSQNILTYNEAVEICLANNQAKMKILDDKLTAISPGTYVVSCDQTTFSGLFVMAEKGSGTVHT